MLFHWSFNEPNGGIISDSIGIYKAAAYGYERKNGCMEFTDGKIHYLPQNLADKLAGRRAVSVYSRFTAYKNAEFDIFNISDKLTGKYINIYVSCGKLGVRLNLGSVKREITLCGIVTGAETEAVVSVSPARITYSLPQKTESIYIGGGGSVMPAFFQCEGDTMHLKNVSISDIAVFAEEKTLAEAVSETDKNVIVDTDPDLAGEWHFSLSDGAVFCDYSGNEFHGTGHRGVQLVTGAAGSAVRFFSRKGSYVDLGCDLDKKLEGKTACTVSMRIQCMYPPNDRQPLWTSFAEDKKVSLQIAVGNGYLLVGGRSCPGDVWQQKLYSFVSYGKWHHLAAVFDYANSRIKLFVDGEEQAPRPSENINWKSPVFVKGNSHLQVQIGGDMSSPYAFNGYIDGVYLFGRALDDIDIKLLYGLHKGEKSEFDIESEELAQIREKTAENAVFCIGSEDVIYNGKRLKLCPKNLNAKTVSRNGTVMIPAEFLKNLADAEFETVLINGVEYADLKQAADAFGMKCEISDNGIVMLCSGKTPFEPALISRLSALFTKKKYPAPKEDYAASRTVAAYADPAGKEYVRIPNINKVGADSFIAMHDRSKNGSTDTHLLKSTDGGKNWTEMYIFKGLCFAAFFEDNGAYYVIGLRNGKINIHKSTDGGYTWTVPENSKSGVLFSDRISCGIDGAMSIAKHNGRIYKAYEERVGPTGGTSWVKDYQAFVVSAPEGSDLLDEANWTMSNKLLYPSSVKPNDTPMVNAKGWLEGNMAVDPDGNVLNLLRFNSDPQAQPGWICIVKVSPDGKTISFDEKDGFAELNGANSRFSVKYDEKTGYYYSLVNSNTDPDFFLQRNVLCLAVSKDLKKWGVLETILADESLIPWQESVRQHSYSYVDFTFDDRDIVFLVRESADNAYNFHDNNYITFYRISDYAEILRRNGKI